MFQWPRAYLACSQRCNPRYRVKRCVPKNPRPFFYMTCWMCPTIVRPRAKHQQMFQDHVLNSIKAATYFVHYVVIHSSPGPQRIPVYGMFGITHNEQGWIRPGPNPFTCLACYPIFLISPSRSGKCAFKQTLAAVYANVLIERGCELS